jgi:uncharacterized protein (DUF2225 family)
VVELTCPVCGREKVPRHALRPKSQQIQQNKFLVPTYEGTLGYRTVDYTLHAVTVCPRCLFASPDKKDFTRSATDDQEEVESQLTGDVIAALQEKAGERRAMLKSISDFEEYFAFARLDDAAIASYRLAMARAGVEASYERPYSLYKLGAYALRIAKIMKDAGMDNQEVLREALGYFEETFQRCNCPAEEIEMQVIYTLVALSLKLGDSEKARSYVGAFDGLRNARIARMKHDSGLDTLTIDKWAEKANSLWKNRDDPDLFENE